MEEEQEAYKIILGENLPFEELPYHSADNLSILFGVEVRSLSYPRVRLSATLVLMIGPPPQMHVLVYRNTVIKKRTLCQLICNDSHPGRHPTVPHRKG